MALSVASVFVVVMLVAIPPRWLRDTESWRWLALPVAVAAVIVVHALVLNTDGRTRAYFECFAWFGIGFSITFAAAHASRLERSILITAVGMLVLFEAIYGFADYLRGDLLIFGRWERGADVLTGTFVNRNHAADLFAAGSLLVIGSVIRARLALPIRLALAACIWIGCALAVVATQSRLGMIALITGSVVLAYASASPSARARPGLFVGAAIALLLASGLWFGPGALLERFAGLFAAEDRRVLWGHMISQPISMWIQGIGPGQFEDVFKTISPASLTRSYPEAHNDYLEFVFEFGIIGSMVVGIAAWITLAKHLTHGRPYAPAWAGLAVFIVHAAGDFPLQVPGTAALFWLLLGLAVEPDLAREKGRHATRHRRTRRSRRL